MRDDRKNSIYNPCEQCAHRKELCHCPFGKRTMCSQFLFAQYVNSVELDGGEAVPDEVLVALLRKKGWHGELRQQISVQI